MRSLNYRLWQDSFGYQRLPPHCAILPHAAQQINELATKFYVRNVGYKKSIVAMIKDEEATVP